MRDGIALLVDELWSCLDDVQQFQQALHTRIALGEFGAATRGAKTAANVADGEPPSEVEFARPFALTDPIKVRLLFTPLQIMRSRISHDTLTLSITSL